MFDFKDNVVFVTGASGGIGGQIARDFGGAGAKVVVHNFDLKAATDKLLSDLEAARVEHLLVEGDVTDPSEVRTMVDAIKVRYGRLDILVNNAGAAGEKRPFGEMPLEVWERTVSINLTSVFLVTQACLPLLLASKRASVVNLSSTGARNGGVINGSPYSAAKGAVSTLTRGLAKDLGRHGIRVNAVAPGLIDTAFHGDGGVKERYAERIKSIPLQRAGVPADVSRPVLFLASPLAGYITGEVLEISGGLSVIA